MTKKRLEFTKAVKLEIFKRAGGPENLHCEGCGMPLRGKAFEYDHIVEMWEQPDRKTLTAADGKLLGRDCCHKEKSARKTGERAHGNRIIAKTAGIKKPGSKIQSRGFATNRDGRWKKKMDGTTVRREL